MEIINKFNKKVLILHGICNYYIFRDEDLETIEITENMVNPNTSIGPQDFQLLKLIGRGNYGKVIINLYEIIQQLQFLFCYISLIFMVHKIHNNFLNMVKCYDNMYV